MMDTQQYPLIMSSQHTHTRTHSFKKWLLEGKFLVMNAKVVLPDYASGYSPAVTKPYCSMPQPQFATPSLDTD